MNDDVVLNIFGTPDSDFIEEVSDREAVLKNRLYFALAQEGLPRELEFGVGIPQLIGEGNTFRIKRSVKQKTEEVIPAYINDVVIGAVNVQNKPEDQVLEVDLFFEDLTTKEPIYVPLALPK
ncbi:MAG: hypothetical protein ACYSR7_04450 [Planctomycetota bacterium]|jgi:hypothetical protein